MGEMTQNVPNDVTLEEQFTHDALVDTVDLADLRKL